MSAALEDESDPTYTHFGHRAEFLGLLDDFLKLDLRGDVGQREDEAEERLVNQLGDILDYYLPLPGLLDPSLNEIVDPLMAILSSALTSLVNDDHARINEKRLHRLGKVINWVVKVRGWKAIVSHFPSSIPNLPILITLLSPPTSAKSSSTPDTPHHPLLSSQEAWQLRSVLLLWLALLLTVPFNLSALSSETEITPRISNPAFDALFAHPTSELAARVVLLALPLLHRPGKEGSYAALVLARLYSRSDAVGSLPGFFAWARMELDEGDREAEANFVASLFEFLAILPGMLAADHLVLLHDFKEDVVLPHLRGSRTAASSGLVRKLAVKARGRWWIARLGHRQAADGTTGSDETPDGLEEELDDLMTGLSDKDTIVRYSCAKYLARLSSLLPPDFAEQIVMATINLFAGTEDEPVIATSFGIVVDPGGAASVGGTMGFGGSETMRGEARWHGCCLAIAEMARRGLVKDVEAIAESVKWVMQALTFDLRRASHSIGANVRDAAAYLLWSLSRACPPSALEHFAVDIATSLIRVACFDREVGVRRAASAAFQEGVGRLGLYPEGIDVLGKTDFYSVSVRRIAFSSAAPAVATHAVYRDPMREHLHHITLRHWDITMRKLGAVALRDLLGLRGAEDMQDSIDREIKQIPSLDPADVHGAMVALTQIVGMLDSADERRTTILHSISSIRPAALVSSTAAEIVEAACDLMTACLSPICLAKTILDELVSHYLDLVMKRKEADCYEAAARMIGRLSELRPATKEIDRLTVMINSPRPIPRQIATLIFGHVQYASCKDRLRQVFQVLWYQLADGAKADVETRRYAVRSLTSILGQRDEDGLLVSAAHFQAAFTSFINALNDYSTDQRGDVGSWIRCAGLVALGQAIAIASAQEAPTELVTQDMFQLAVSGFVKLGMEKLETVRAASWRAVRMLRDCQASSRWHWEGSGVWDFPAEDDSDESFRYIDLRSWYSSAMPLLKSRYRSALVSGMIHSVGSQVESVSGVAFAAFKEYALPERPLVLAAVVSDLHAILTAHVNSNRVFLPAMATATRTLSDDRLAKMLENSDATKSIVGVIAVACRAIPQIKSIDRISGSLKLVVASLALSDQAIQRKVLDVLPLFLAHRFPRIRSMTAEAVYLRLSDMHDEVDPELEEALLETDWTGEVEKEDAERVVMLLRRGSGCKCAGMQYRKICCL